MAVDYALKKWRHYLRGENLEAVTDKLSLRGLLSLKDPRDRPARWVLEIQSFDFTSTNEKGSTMLVLDTLSRDAVPKTLCQRCYRLLCDVEGPTANSVSVNVLYEFDIQ